MLIGPKIRELRKQRKMSLTRLAEASGVQPATLSRIENQKMTGTLESHMNIAKALGITITQLYRDVSEKGAADNHRIDLKTPRSISDVFVHSDKASYEILTGQVLSKKMMPILLKVEPGGKTTLEQNADGTDKFVFVVEGQIEAKIGGKSFQLSKHHTLYFDASLEHWFENGGRSTARVLCISTPVAL